MASYAAQSDVEAVFGVQNVALWSNLTNTGTTADAARITTAIGKAQASIDSRFRTSRYVVPFSPVPSEVTDWTAKLAGIWLYESRSKRADAGGAYDDMKREVDDEIGAFLAQTRTFDAALKQSQATVPWGCR